MKKKIGISFVIALLFTATYFLLNKQSGEPKINDSLVTETSEEELDDEVDTVIETVEENTVELRVIDGVFKTDGKNLYRYGRIYESTWYDETQPRPETLIDMDTFVHATSSYYKDKNDVYRHNEGIETDQLKNLNADLDSFNFLGELVESRFFWKDKNSVYYVGEKIENSNPDTFQFIGMKSWGEEYYKDSSQVYFLFDLKDGPGVISIVEGADSKTFEIIYDDLNKDSEDINGSYRRGVLVESK
jgi:hypothetical protein